MAEIKLIKPLGQNDMYKGVTNTYSAQKYAYGDGSEAGADCELRCYYVERDADSWNTQKLQNLFMSFGLSRTDTNEWFRSFQSFDWYNSKRMVIMTIPETECGSYIEGNTLTVNVPTGNTLNGYVTFYGASYAGFPDTVTGYELSAPKDESVYGGASIFLFPNTRGTGAGVAEAGTYTTDIPFTGNVNGSAQPNAGLSLWTDANVDSESFFPHLRATSWGRNPDNAYDIPYGIAFLEKGIFVIFDMYGRDDVIAGSGSIIDQAVWVYGSANYTPQTYTGGTLESNTNSDNRNNIIFSGSYGLTNAKVSFRTVTSSYKMIYFCHAGQGEFNSTTNPTYNHKKAYFRPDDADSLWITEVGLYDDFENLLAYAKLSEPVEKSKLDTLTFKVELQI